MNGNTYGNIYSQSFISNSENTIQLTWDYVHFYHDYDLLWWTEKSFPKTYSVTITQQELAKTRFQDIEYYSFVDNDGGTFVDNDIDPFVANDDVDTFVYYIQIKGWLYGRGYGKPSKVLKCLKPYKGD